MGKIFRMLMMLFVLVSFLALPQVGLAEEYAPGEEVGKEKEEKKKEEAKKEEKIKEEKKATKLEEIVVESKRLVKEQGKVTIKSEGLPSQVQVITKEDIERLVVRDDIDLFRKVPGVRAFSWGQGDVGVQNIAMRGFSSGGDVAMLIDGVPQNFPSYGGGRMADFPWLTPGTIERIEVLKGPFSALYGNYAQSGVINIITKNRDTSPSSSLQVGSFGTSRATAIISKETWSPALFLVYDWQRADGYRDNSDYDKLSLFNKVTLPLRDGNLSLRFNYYKSDYNSPGYLFIDDVKRGIVDRKSAFAPTDGGKQRRYSLVANYSPFGKEEGLYVDAYAESWEIERFYTFQVYPSQQSFFDDRKIFGGRAFYNLAFKEFAAITAGVETRYDDADMPLYKTTDRQRTSTISDYRTKQLNIAAFLQAQTRPFDILKIVGGIRYDYFDIDIENKTVPAYSGGANPSIFSPKIGFVLTPTKNFNIFANKGFGFRSPATQEMSPPTTKGKKNLDLECAQVDTWDIGFNTTLFEKLFLAFDYYQTDMEREIRFVAGEATNIGKTQRDGYEVETKLYVTPGIVLFASYAWVDAKVKNPVNPGQDRVTGVPKNIISCGIETTKELGRGKLQADLYYQYRSSQPIGYRKGETTAVESPPYDIYNLRLAYEVKNWSFSVATAYQPREYSSDGVVLWLDKLTFCPRPEWDVTAGVKYQF